MKIKVNNLNELQQALKQNESLIEITNSIVVPSSLQIPKGTALNGTEERPVLLSFENADGLALEGNNTISNIALQTAPDHRAIYINSLEEDLGTIELNKLTVTGQVQILTRAPQKSLNLKVDGLNIVSADTRRYTEKPLKYGVTVYQGALTVYNYNSDKEALINASIENVSIGNPLAPVIGTGVFIAGFNENGGQVQLNKLHTNAIYSNGMIPFGQPTLITAGIFILSGAHAKSIITDGPVTTYGVNDMVLDVWGIVDEWVVNDYIRSYGTSGIGFVNFGEVKHFVAKYPIETYGSGARGFNQYDGTIDYAEFEAITTYGDGSIGMQFSKPVGSIKVNKSIETYGGSGESLVKGEIQTLSAIALSIKEGGAIESLTVLNDITTHGEEVQAVVIDEGAELNTVSIEGAIITQHKQPITINNETLDKDVKQRLEGAIKSIKK
ncbi:hypothetical protein KYI11_00680 [Macrococcoides bohemicum]|uniref:Uncharacterized protein n=1 Tax=Macrococcoides bohemicum TaxID=1903056 RepID=A0AAE7Q3C3_9STAP|nr:hypothetical protein [Macrococcus bohemicus]QRN48738.1 hypothetical protein HT586_00835 [Macrococcus bohemicus]QYA42496.1 hypothetical protein KYI11_00680 [Macrococcus bohemicus]